MKLRSRVLPHSWVQARDAVLLAPVPTEQQARETYVELGTREDSPGVRFHVEKVAVARPFRKGEKPSEYRSESLISL